MFRLCLGRSHRPAALELPCGRESEPSDLTPNSDDMDLSSDSVVENMDLVGPFPEDSAASPLKRKPTSLSTRKRLLPSDGDDKNSSVPPAKRPRLDDRPNSKFEDVPTEVSRKSLSYQLY
jgi:hypothetical protein